MTISTTNNKTILVANGVLVQFDFTFKIFATSDIGVYVDDVLTTTGFTVSGLDSDSGGSITFSTPPLDQKTITMIRSIEFTQEADYVEGDPFSPDVHERQLDRQVMMNQQSKEVIDRAIKMPASESNAVVLPSSAARSSRVLSFDGSGDLEAGPLTVDVEAVADNATNINAAAANETNINAAVANAANINAAVANQTNINAAVANETNINAAVANEASTNTVAGIADDVTSTADNGVDISFVAANLADILLAATALAALDTATDSDGWTSSSDTWVYVDANTFKIVGVDRSSEFPVGAKVQLTNPAVKYRYVSSVAFSTDTTVTLLNNAGTALANSVITLPKYSYQDTPAGFPDWGSGDQISALALEVATNVTDIETNTAAIATNVTDIATINATSRKNRIINGDMHIHQRGTAAATITSSGFIVDRFATYNNTGTGTLTGEQSTLGNSSSVKVTATAALTDLSGTKFTYGVRYFVEAQDVYDLNGKTVTLSFKVETNWTGSLPVSLRNSAANRSYTINTPVVSGINTVTVSFLFEAATVLLNDNAAGLYLAIGSNNEDTLQNATADAWVAGNFLCTTASTQWAKTTGNFINVTEVQLEEGAIATGFERRHHGEELALCQRYFRLFTLIRPQVMVYTPNGSTRGVTAPISPEMRTAPTLTSSSYSFTGIWAGYLGDTSNQVTTITFAATDQTIRISDSSSIPTNVSNCGTNVTGAASETYTLTLDSEL